jgi:hypothetical protein
MERLKILTAGRSPKAGNKLFEAMASETLHHYGYRPDRVLNIDDSGMEIEIEGKHKPTGTSFYAACKCGEKDISLKEIQAFYGNYMTKWHKDKECHGLFIVLPGVALPAKEFYRDQIESNPDVTVRLFEETDVLKAISETHGVVGPGHVGKLMVRGMGKLGDCLLLYTQKGLFWVQYIISHGNKTPDRIALFSAGGAPLSDKSILSYIVKLYPELDNFEKIYVEDTAAFQADLFQDEEEIIELKGSSECFQYRCPASAKHFVGRKSLIAELDAFSVQVINKNTSLRCMLFESPSGWGKSSMILAGVAHLSEMGHCALAVDSRSALSPRFIVHVVDYAVRRLGDSDDFISDKYHSKSITRFDSAVKAILNIGKILESQGKLMVVFLDHFETILFMPEVLKHVRNLFLKVIEAKTNVIFCFSWKTDVIGSNNAVSGDFYNLVFDSSKHIMLGPFSDVESNVLFDRLSGELDETLRKDLKFFLSEFSHGYPWLLKRLCAHVRAQIQAGVTQASIAKDIHNIEKIIRADLYELSEDEKASLYYMANVAPVRMSTLSKILDPPIFQSLVRRELVVKIGNSCDLYSNTFSDYLNTQVSPVLESYIFQTQIGQVIKAVRILSAANGPIETIEFKKQTGFSDKLFYRLIRDMALFGLVQLGNGTAALQEKFSQSPQENVVLLRKHLKNRLQGNRLVRLLLKTLEEKRRLTISEVSGVLETSCPYISATRPAWLTHARIIVKWMDASDLAVLDPKNKCIIRFDPETEIRERRLLLPKRRGAKTPWIQYAHVENTAARLVRALEEDGRVDWTGLSKHTIFRALAALEDLGFIQRRAPLIKLLPKGMAFALNPAERSLLFAEGALQIDSFAKFIKILNTYKNEGNTLLKIGLELREKLGAGWKQSTAETIAQIMLDWARHAEQAPGVFADSRRGPLKGWKRKNNGQMALF